MAYIILYYVIFKFITFIFKNLKNLHRKLSTLVLKIINKQNNRKRTHFLKILFLLSSMSQNGKGRNIPFFGEQLTAGNGRVTRRKFYYLFLSFQTYVVPKCKEKCNERWGVVGRLCNGVCPKSIDRQLLDSSALSMRGVAWAFFDHFLHSRFKHHTILIFLYFIRHKTSFFSAVSFFSSS